MASEESIRIVKKKEMKMTEANPKEDKTPLWVGMANLITFTYGHCEWLLRIRSKKVSCWTFDGPANFDSGHGETGHLSSSYVAFASGIGKGHKGACLSFI